MTAPSNADLSDCEFRYSDSEVPVQNYLLTVEVRNDFLFEDSTCITLCTNLQE
jgi:hypothetical protein